MNTTCVALALAMSATLAAPALAQSQAPPFRAPQGQHADAQRAWAAIQGFNIVLLVGETKGASSAVDDIPAGARRALNDMKEFLPYKNYRVLDSQWTSCCAGTRSVVLAGRLQGESGGDARTGTYPFTVAVSPNGEGSSLQVQFSLRDTDGRSDHDQLVADSRVQELLAQYEHAQQQYDELRKRVSAGVAPSRDLQIAENRTLDLERQVAAMRALSSGGREKGGRMMISSSFTMDIGETVVVGTSRLGGDRALIALVTAARKGGVTGRD
jgi:hypothetical protein